MLVSIHEGLPISALKSEKAKYIAAFILLNIFNIFTGYRIYFSFIKIEILFRVYSCLVQTCVIRDKNLILNDLTLMKL